jgi:DNA-binding CsgD family transcriptional regulator
MVKDNAQVEVVSEFGFKAKESLIGVSYDFQSWQDKHGNYVSTSTEVTLWVEKEFQYLIPLKANNVNIGYAQITFKNEPAQKDELEDLIHDISACLSLYLNYQKRLNAFSEELAQLTSSVKNNYKDAGKKVRSLSARHRMVLQLLSANLTNGQIAIQLGFSPATIHADTSEIYRVLGVENRKGAIALCAHLEMIK